ncbi:hypothetical protein HY991_00280, partial [Candidatus Micrarchaeota archaeon]|nr:hypothetical protein [Candidatus Micrarchaeota archaeon]
SAKGWLEAVEKLNKAAREKSGGGKLDEKKLKQYVAKLLAELDEVSSDDEEVKFHISAAKEAFKRGDYLASSYDASFAIAYNSALDQTKDESIDEIQKSLVNETNSKSVWAQLYFIHSIYSMAEGNRSDDTDFYLNAFKLQLLSNSLNTNLEETKLELAKSVPPVEEAPRIEVSISPIGKPEANKLLILMGIITVAAVLVAAVALIVVIARQRSKPLGFKEKLDRLDELLLEGKISEKTYERLAEKYSRELRPETIELKEREPRKTAKKAPKNISPKADLLKAPRKP